MSRPLGRPVNSSALPVRAAPGRRRVSAPRLDPAQQQRQAGPLVIPRGPAVAFVLVLLVFSCITHTWFFLPPLLFALWKVKYGNL